MEKPIDYEVEYELISLKSITSFNERCNELSKAGWTFTGPVTVLFIEIENQKGFSFMQQWMLVKQVSIDHQTQKS